VTGLTVVEVPLSDQDLRFTVEGRGTADSRGGGVDVGDGAFTVLLRAGRASDALGPHARVAVQSVDRFGHLTVADGTMTYELRAKVMAAGALERHVGVLCDLADAIEANPTA
jgi:hypothetical protein